MKPPASLTALATELKSLNAGPAHQDRVLRAWLRGHPLDHGPRKQAAENFLPLALRTALPQLQAALDALATVVSEHPGSDGRRLLVRLGMGRRWKACCCRVPASASRPRLAAPSDALSA